MATTKTPIVVPVDNKSFGWCGGLSGCIRTSTAVVLPAKAKLKLPKPTEVSSSEEEEEEEEEEPPEVFDRLTKLIDNFLDQAGSQEDEWSGKVASAAASLFTSSSGWIDSLSSKSKTVFDELTSTKFRDIATTADEICKVLAKTHWAAAGLLVVAAVINNIEKVQRVDKECMELLRSIHTVGTSLNRFRLLRHRPAEMAANIKRAESVIPLGTALCLGIIQSGKLKKFFQSRTNESKILSCRQKLERLQNDLNFQLHFADYAERHEPGGRLQDESKSKFDLGIKKITKQEESQKNTGPSEKSTPGNGDTTPAPRSTTDKDSSETKKDDMIESASQQQTTPAPPDTSKGKNCMQKCKENFKDCKGTCTLAICRKKGWSEIWRSCNVSAILPYLVPAQSKDNLFIDTELPNNNITDPDSKIKEMLDLQSDNKGVAVFLWGDENTGKKKLADKVWSTLENDPIMGNWLQVRIKSSDINRSSEGLASPIDIVSRMRLEILKKLQANGQRTGNAVEIQKDRAWGSKLSASLPKDKNVFIYIDYVIPSADILKKIFPNRFRLNKPIRVLLTVEGKHVTSALDGSKIQRKLYPMQPLSYKEALNLMCKDLTEDMCQNLRKDKHFLTKIIKICSGYEKRMDDVRDYLSKYYKVQNDLSRLIKWISTKEPTFNELKDYFSCEEKFLKMPADIKDALLDICSFFNNWEWNQVACILGNDALKKLEESKLVKRDYYKVSVSSTVITFGLSRSQGNRVTNVADLYTSISEHHEIKGIWLPQNKFPFHLPSEQLDKMHASLRVLALGDSIILKGKCKKKFKNLRYYQAGRAVNHPFNIANLHQPRFFESNSDKDIGLISQKVPLTLRMVKLKTQNVQDCIDLQKLLPRACKFVELDISCSDVKEFPKEFGKLYALQKLILTNCKKITILPKPFGKIRSLKILDLSHCEELIELPSNFGWLSTLEKVNLAHCSHLNELPDSIGLLNSVNEIDLSYCKNIKKLPKSFVKLLTLRVLKLRACSNLLELPEGFEDLALTEICLESCKRLKSLPQRIGQTTLLQKTVSLSWCLSLPELSIGFINLIRANVEHLILVDCTGLQELPEEFIKELSRLKTLNLSGCRSLLRLPKRFQKLQCLEKLNLGSCEKLEELPLRLSGLPLLIEVNLSNCERLKGSCLSSLRKVKSLRFIDIQDSPHLVERWNQMKRENKVCNFTVATGCPFGSPSFHSLPLSRDSVIVMENKGTSPFFNDKWSFVNRNGQPFYPSTLEKGTSVAVIFYNYDKEVLQALGKTLDDLQITCKTLQIVHVGRCVTELPREWAGRFHVCSCDNYEAQVFFEKQLSMVQTFAQAMGYAMMVSEVVMSEEGKVFSSWTGITMDSLRDMKVDVSTTTQYFRLKELIETPQLSNIELLQALLLTKETNFLIKSTCQVGLKELEGKFIFLLISWLDKFQDEHSTFNTVYEKLKEKLQEEPLENNPGFEVVWIPIVNHGRGTPALHAKWVEEITWPSIADPWSSNPLAKHFLRMHSSLDKLPLFTGVSPKGKLHFQNFIPDTEKTGIEDFYNFIKT